MITSSSDDITYTSTGSPHFVCNTFCETGYSSDQMFCKYHYILLYEIYSSIALGGHDAFHGNHLKEN